MRKQSITVGVWIVGAVASASVGWIGCSSTEEAPPGTSTPDAGGGVETGPGSDTGPGPTTDSSTTPDGSSNVDSGPKIDPPSGPFVDLTYGSCPALAGCGGDPIGRWNVTGGCVDESVFAQATEACPAIVISDVKFQGRGYVDASATTIVRATEVKVTGKFNVPESCKMVVGSCATIGAALQALAGIDTATCLDDGAGGCDCAIADTRLDSSSNGYTTSATTLTTTASTPQTYEYCVDTNKVSYQETTGGTVQPYVVELTK